MKQLILVLLMLFGTTSAGISSKNTEIKLESKPAERLSVEMTPAPTPAQIVYSTLIDNGMSDSMAVIVVAQARFESKNFQSELTLDHNNVFGMQHPHTRPTTSIGPFASAEGRRGRYASYLSISDSAKDLIYWLEFSNIPLNISSADKYVLLLKREHYFEMKLSTYRMNVKGLMKQSINT